MINSKQRSEILGVLLLSLIGSGVYAQSEYLDGNAAVIEAFLDQNFRETNAGMVIGLVDEHGTRVFSAGWLDNGTGGQVDGDTVFEMGSVTKAFTSLLLLDAVNRGEMKLDDPVVSYLPDGVIVPKYGDTEITLLNLAVQDSGLPWNTPHQEKLLKSNTGKPDFDAFKKGAAAFTTERLHEMLSTYELTSRPGERFQYSNVGMALLGHAIEQATGRGYESLVVKRICEPLRDARYAYYSFGGTDFAARTWTHVRRNESPFLGISSNATGRWLADNCQRYAQAFSGKPGNQRIPIDAAHEKIARNSAYGVNAVWTLIDALDR